MGSANSRCSGTAAHVWITLLNLEQSARSENLSIQINSHRQQFRSEESHRCRIPARTTYLRRKPALSCWWIILGNDVRCARTPAADQSITPLYPHFRVRLDVADVSGLSAVFSHDPELPAYATIAYWCAPWLAALAPHRFEQRVLGPRYAHSKQRTDREIQKVLLQEMDDAVLHDGYSLKLGSTRNPHSISSHSGT